MGSTAEKFVSLANKFTEDPEILETMQQIERDIFHTTKTDVNVHKFGYELSNAQRTFLEKYHSSMALKSATSTKLAQKLQVKLLKELVQMIEEKVGAERSRLAMIQEQKDYWIELNKEMHNKLTATIPYFEAQATHNKNVIDYVLEQEENESDEDFNVFDKIAAGYSDRDATNRISNDFLGKIQRINEKVASEAPKEQKLEQYLSMETLTH